MANKAKTADAVTEVTEATEAVQVTEQKPAQKKTILLPLHTDGSPQTEWFCLNGHEFTIPCGEVVEVEDWQYELVMNQVIPARAAAMKTKMAGAQ